MITGRGRLSLRDTVDLLLIGAAHGFSDGYSNLLVPVIALIVADLGLSETQVGLLLGACSLSGFLFVFPTSLAADHSGRKLEILLVGLALASAAYFTMLAAAAFLVLVVLAFLANAGNAVYHPCGTALTAERFPGIRPYAISTHGMMGNIGAAAIPFLLAFVAEAAGWRWALAVSTLPVVVLLPLLRLRFKAGPPPVPSGPADGRVLAHCLAIARQVLRDRSVLVLALTFSLSGMAVKSSMGFLPLLASRRFGFTTATIGLFMSLYFGMGIVSKPLMSYVYARFGARPAIGLPLLLSCAANLAIGLTSWPWLLVALVALIGLADPISPVILTAAADCSSSSVLASSVGLIYSLHALGFVAPVIGGWIAEKAGLPLTYAFSSALFLAAALMTGLIGKAGGTVRGGLTPPRHFPGTAARTAPGTVRRPAGARRGCPAR